MNLKTYLSRKMEDPEFRREWEAGEGEFQEKLAYIQQRDDARAAFEESDAENCRLAEALAVAERERDEARRERDEARRAEQNAEALLFDREDQLRHARFERDQARQAARFILDDLAGYREINRETWETQYPWLKKDER